MLVIFILSLIKTIKKDFFQIKHQIKFENFLKMDSQINELEKKIVGFVSEMQADFSPDRLTKNKKIFDEFIKEIDLSLESLSR